MRPERIGPERNEQGKGDFSLIGVFVGLLLGLYVSVGSHVIHVNEGRKAEIAVCGADYGGVLQVKNLVALEGLSKVAEKHGIGDYEASEPARDPATLRGELACRQAVGNGSETIIVLTPSGLDALQRTGVQSGTLPDGIEWRVQLPNPAAATTTTSTAASRS